MCQAYKKSALFAMVCGAITCALGVSCLFLTQKAMALIGVVTAAVLVNMVLHFESFTNSLREGKRPESVLAIAVAELFFVCFGLHTLFVRGEMGWYSFQAVFAFYLVVNAASLLVMPIRLAQVSGALALLTAILLYASAQNVMDVRNIAVAGAHAPAALCLALIVNGAERIQMSMKGGRKPEKKTDESHKNSDEGKKIC